MLNHIVLDKDATNYFRAIVKLGETSNRVLDLTEDIIRLNPAHYSAWSVPDSARRSSSHIKAVYSQAIPLQDSTGNQLTFGSRAPVDGRIGSHIP